MQELKVSYNYKQISDAALWISQNNPYGFTEKDIEEDIYRGALLVLKMLKTAHEELPDKACHPMYSTAGFYVQVEWMDDFSVELVVLVDPSLPYIRKGVHVCSTDVDTMIEWMDDYDIV